MNHMSIKISLPRSAEEAQAIGANKYFTGEACAFGHIADRYVSNRACAQCSRERANRRPEGGRAKAKTGAAQPEPVDVEQPSVTNEQPAATSRSDVPHHWREKTDEEKAFLRSELIKRRIDARALKDSGQAWSPTLIPIGSKWTIHTTDVCRATHIGYEEIFDRVDKHLAHNPEAISEFIGIKDRVNGWIPIGDLWMTEAGVKMTSWKGYGRKLLLDAFSNAGPIPGTEVPPSVEPQAEAAESEAEVKEEAGSANEQAKPTESETLNAEILAMRSDINKLLSGVSYIYKALMELMNRPAAPVLLDKSVYRRLGGVEKTAYNTNLRDIVKMIPNVLAPSFDHMAMIIRDCADANPQTNGQETDAAYNNYRSKERESQGHLPLDAVKCAAKSPA